MHALLDRYEAVLRETVDGYTVLRVGLGGLMLLVGVHTFVDPLIWGSYVAPWFAAVSPIPVDTFMAGLALFQIGIGAIILANRYVTAAASLAALSIFGIVVNLASTGSATDILIRDLGLLALAVGVALLSAQRD